jgi:hypothetical protein
LRNRPARPGRQKSLTARASRSSYRDRNTPKQPRNSCKKIQSAGVVVALAKCFKRPCDIGSLPATHSPN